MKKRIDCQGCGRYLECDGLCEKAEIYVAQDEVKQREETIGIPVIKKPFRFLSAPMGLTKREHEIVTLLEIHGFSRKETAQYLKISRESLRTHLSRIRNKIPRQAP